MGMGTSGTGRGLWGHKGDTRKDRDGDTWDQYGPIGASLSPTRRSVSPKGTGMAPQTPV